MTKFDQRWQQVQKQINIARPTTAKSLFELVATVILVFLIIVWLMTFTAPGPPQQLPWADFGGLLRTMLACCLIPIPITILIVSVILKSKRIVILSLILVALMIAGYVAFERLGELRTY